MNKFIPRKTVFTVYKNYKGFHHISIIILHRIKLYSKLLLNKTGICLKH